MRGANMNKLLTVVIPVYNTDPGYLDEALRSVASQTLSIHEMRIVIVDDGSYRDRTINRIDELNNKSEYQGIKLEVVRHASNQWLAQSRNTGAAVADSEFIVFLDSDDFVSPDYFKKAIYLLRANPLCSWVYPDVHLFCDIIKHKPAKSFRPFVALFKNEMPSGSVYRHADWIKVGQREIMVSGGYRFFEDWDMIIRLMCKGKFGAPLSDAHYYYRKRSDGELSRPTKIFLLSVYQTLHCNLKRLPLVMRSYICHKKFKKRYTGEQSRLNPLRYVSALLRKLLLQVLDIGRMDLALDLKTIMLAICLPSVFKKRFLDPTKIITLAELQCGFKKKPLLKLSPPEQPVAIDQQTILFAHAWWAIGGAENVLSTWIEAARSSGFERILDVTQYSADENQNVKASFACLVHEQHCLDRIGDTPQERLNYCWQMLCAEKPAVVFISGNLYFYALLPLIKRHFPEITVIDTLHNEFDNLFDIFNMSEEYQEFIDRRIVISEHWRNVLINKYKTNLEKIHVQPNTVDIERFQPNTTGEDVTGPLGLPRNKRIVSFVGRLHDQKQPEVFISLAERFRADPLWHFAVIGDGDLYEKLHAQAAGLDNITFVGSTQVVEKYLQASDLVVFTSRFEGYPLVSMEAAATNTPVIAPNITGFAEQIQAGGFGQLYQPTGDADADSHTIAEMMTSGFDDLCALGKNGRNFIVDKHNPELLKHEQVIFLSRVVGRDFEAQSSRPNKKLYLHIGLPKTGSSSIQYFLYKNRAILSQQGLIYPDIMSHGYGHHLCAHYFSANPNSVPVHIKLQLPDKIEMRRHMADLKYLSHPEILLSSEAFRKANPGKLRDYLMGFDVQIIVFLRRQDHWIESSYNQDYKIRSSHNYGVDEHIARISLMLDYDEFLKPWENAFSKDAITVVPFEHRTFANGLERHFIEIIGKIWDDRFELPGRVNSRLNRDCAEFLNLQVERDRSHKSKYHKLIALLEEYTALKDDYQRYRYVMPPQKRLDLVNAYEASNRRVALDYLGKENGQLFTSPLPKADDVWESYPGLSQGKARKICEFLEQKGIIRPTQQYPLVEKAFDKHNQH